MQTQTINLNQNSEKISQILNDFNLSITEKINQLKSLFSQENTITIKTVKLIDQFLKGQYGSEYLLIQDSIKEIINFYQFLQSKFPDVEQIKLSLADLFLLDEQYNESFNLFNELFYQNPLLIFEVPGEFYEMLEKYGNDQQKISYHLSLVRAFIEDENLEDAQQECDEIIAKYGGNNPYLKDWLRLHDGVNCLI
jgi:hypothetical protein